MKLPLSLIIHALRDVLADPPEELLSDNRLMSRPVFYPPVTRHDKNILLLCDTCVSPFVESIGEHAVVICKAPPEKEMKPACGILVSLTEIRIVSDRLHELFDAYENWVDELNEIVLQHGTVRELLDISEKITGNPISVMGENYIIVAVSAKAAEAVSSGKLNPPFYQGEPLPDATINSFKNNPDFLRSFSIKEPFLYTDDYLPVPVLCSNVFFNNSYCARIIMSETYQELQVWDSFHLGILTEYVQMLFLNAPDIALSVSNDPKTFLALIHREPVSSRELEALYSANGWKLEDCFQMLVVQGSLQDAANNTMDYYMLRIRREFPGCITGVEGKLLYILYNRTQGKTSLQSNAQFSIYIREANFRVGISNDFSDLNNCYYFSEQAQAALQYGSDLEPTIWIHSFKTYAFRYLMEHGAEKIPLSLLCARELIQLENYDQIHGSELYETLSSFLRSGQNATRTAETLHIQRRSLYFRLKKIRDMTGLDFDDFENISYLCVSIIIKESEPKVIFQ